MIRVFVFSLLLVVMGCESSEKPVTKVEALQLGKSLDSCVRRRNGRAFDAFFNTRLLTKRLKSDNIISDAARNKGIQEGLMKTGLGNQIIKTLKTHDDTYSLVKHYETNGVHHLLYRLSGNTGLNYHDFELERYRGKVYIADMYIYLSGENLSKTLSDLMEGTGDWNTKQKKNFEDLDKIKQLYNSKRNKEAKEYYDKLDPQFRNQRSVQLIYVMICSQLGEDTYLEALNNFSHLYPNDPNTNLLLIDASFLRQDYTQAGIYLERLDSLINKDPYLDYYRGLIVKSQGDISGATKYLERLYAFMPEFSGGVLELIANYLDRKKFDQAKEVISYYRGHKKFDQGTLDLVLTMYPNFKE